MIRIVCISFLLLCYSNLFAQWSQTSGPSGGGVSEFAYTDNTILAATFDMGNGVFASTDNGATWHASGLQGIMLNHIVAKGNIVIASSTQNYYNETDTIYRSSDGGASWNIVHIITDTGLAPGIIPNISGVSSICSHNTEWFLAVYGNAGMMFESSDDGLTWLPIKPNIAYAYPVILLSADVNLIAAYNRRGIIRITRSSDNGNSWIDASTGIDTTVAGEIYCGAVGGNTIWFGSTAGIFASTTGGLSWQLSLKLNDPAEYIRSIAGKGNRVLAFSSLDTIYRTESGGNAWDVLTGNGLQSQGHIYSASFSKFDTLVFFGASTGIISSPTLGYHWQYSTAGLLAASVTELVASKGKIFAATEGGISSSSDQGASWQDPQPFASPANVTISGFASGANTLYAYGTGLYSWTGSEWSLADTSVIDALAEGNGGRLFAARRIGDPITGTGEIDVSDNGGTSWTTKLAGKNSLDTQFYFLPHCIAYDGNSTIIAVERALIFESFTSIYIVYRSTNNGESWEALSTVNAPAIVYFANNTFYMGTYGNGFYKSLDNGSTWTQSYRLGIGADVTWIQRIDNSLFVSVTGNGHIYDGLFISNDEGANWKYVNFNNANISGAFAHDGTYLYGGGPSVWRRPLQGLAVKAKNVAEADQLKIYPNPAGDVIHIHFDSPIPGEGNLFIYDEKGMAVYLQQVRLETTADDLQISLQGFSDGAYYAKLVDESDNILSASKFVVERK